jgi:hypothetical protein
MTTPQPSFIENLFSLRRNKSADDLPAQKDVIMEFLSELGTEVNNSNNQTTEPKPTEPEPNDNAQPSPQTSPSSKRKILHKLKQRSRKRRASVSPISSRLRKQQRVEYEESDTESASEAEEVSDPEEEPEDNSINYEETDYGHDSTDSLEAPEERTIEIANAFNPPLIVPAQRQPSSQLPMDRISAIAESFFNATVRDAQAETMNSIIDAYTQLASQQTGKIFHGCEWTSSRMTIKHGIHAKHQHNGKWYCSEHYRRVCPPERR